MGVESGVVFGVGAGCDADGDAAGVSGFAAGAGIVKADIAESAEAAEPVGNVIGRFRV